MNTTSAVSKACYDFVYAPMPGTFAPYYNVASVLLPGIFLCLFLLRSDEQHRKTVLFGGSVPASDGRVDALASLAYTDNNELIMDINKEKRRSWDAHLFNQRSTTSRGILSALRFSGVILPQYYTIVRYLTMVDLANTVVLLLSVNPESVFFKAVGVAIRLAYRWIEFSCCILLCLPMQRHKSNPRLIAFRWHDVTETHDDGRGSAPSTMGITSDGDYLRRRAPQALGASKAERPQGLRNFTKTCACVPSPGSPV